ncbi:hypothetical protein DXG03_004190 [Asterophora parasitica]|uniref:Uncharacterized protein n=1 Tax=Asterophora parasitica TaxID=117018 RepID=A0A9P7K7Z4_9AGAR|nr:hypothetical protein DXG03_004190 [Asterophora parasitica]
MFSKVKSSEETEKLQARLPAQLAPFASNISIVGPIRTVSISLNDGIHYSACEVKERRIPFGTRVARLVDNVEVPHRICGFAHAFYFPPIRDAEALTGRYDDSGTSESESTHGNVKSVVKEVARDMGLREVELDNELEVLEALLHHDGKQLLGRNAEEGKTLRKIIEDEITEEEDPYW